MKTAKYWIKKLRLIKHPEGGYFREVYRSKEDIRGKCLPKRYEGPRSFSTSIYYLLMSDDVSYLHRIKSDEIWHFYQGSPLTIYVINEKGISSKMKLGSDLEGGQVFQALVPAGRWFGAIVANPDTFSLVGCTVAPGYDFRDFELAKRNRLIKLFPRQRAIIERLTRD